MTLLILYEELAMYFIKCISTFERIYNAEIHIIHKETNSEAPFLLNSEKRITTYMKSDYSDDQLIELVRNINPDAIFCGGWATSVYLKIAKRYKGKIKTIIGFDNKWDGSLKQRIASVIAPLYITNKFSGCYVPGPEQKKFAINIGFDENQIRTGAYCCDFDFFYGQFLENREAKKNDFPKRFIFVGRYVENKGIHDLWNAFIELQKETPNDWELWCLGTGNISPADHPKIKHFGFVQPAQLRQFTDKTGVFILPSHFEPWGVVVHEFASAGFPIVCTNEVGARLSFVKNHYNGYIYNSGNVSELKEILTKIITTEQNELVEMSCKSVELAKQLTPEVWAKQLKSLL